MDGRTFELFLATLFERLGFRVELIVVRDGRRLAVQGKRWGRRVGVKAVQEAVASVGLYRCDVALVVTTSGFTEQARKLAAANKVSLWEREVLPAKILAADAAPQAPTAEPRCAACGKEVSERGLAAPDAGL